MASRIACVAFVLVATVAASAAASAAPLTLQEAVRYALTHNSTIASRQATLANLEANFAKAHAAEFPPISGSLSNTMARSSNALGSFAQIGATPASRFSQNTAQIGTQWTLYNGSLNQILAQESKRQVEGAREDLRQSQNQITQSVVSAYYSVASKSNATLLANSNLSYQQTLFSVAQAKERAGMIAGVDVLRADAALQQASAAKISAESDEATARENLAQLIGAPVETTFAAQAALPQPALPAAPLDTLLQTAHVSRPDIASAAANVAFARLSRAAIDADLRPQIALNAAFGNQTSPTTFVNQQAQIDSLNQFCRLAPTDPNCSGAPFPNVARGTPGFWQISATSTFAVPLIDYGTRRAQHRAGDEQIDSALLNLISVQTAADADVRQSLRGAQTALATLGYQRKAASLATESARIAQLQYKNGLISLTDVNAAQQTALSAQTDYFNARVAYINAIVKLRSSLGTLDPLSIVADLH
ncbi:MAG: hypothetical protein DLM50_06105 [Candidatus Meridianibacter frigidus]|nr:MAG: hypothetical protein DLM50_06105 [Candidatus Eremiobacteraeota bacterium]